MKKALVMALALLFTASTASLVLAQDSTTKPAKKPHHTKHHTKKKKQGFGNSTGSSAPTTGTSK